MDKCLDQVKKNNIVNKYVQQLVNSEYTWKMCREIVVSGLVGYERKLKHKKLHGIPIYRSNKFSLRDRVNRKLTEKYNWFRTKKNENCDENEEICLEKVNDEKGKWKHYDKKKEPIEHLEKVEVKDMPPQAVLFVQFTPNSELASRIRDVILKLKPWTGINLKVIERVGEKIEDMIHRSNPWDDVNCERAECFSCKSSAKMSEPKNSYCKTRSIVYQTWCQTCLDSRKLKNVNECESKVKMGINIVHTNVESVNEGDECNSDVNSIHTDRIMMKNDELTLLSHLNDPNVNSSELEVESTIVNETCSTESPENIEYSWVWGGPLVLMLIKWFKLRIVQIQYIKLMSTKI